MVLPPFVMFLLISRFHPPACRLVRCSSFAQIGGNDERPPPPPPPPPNRPDTRRSRLSRRIVAMRVKESVAAVCRFRSQHHSMLLAAHGARPLPVPRRSRLGSIRLDRCLCRSTGVQMGVHDPRIEWPLCTHVTINVMA